MRSRATRSSIICLTSALVGCGFLATRADVIRDPKEYALERLEALSLAPTGPAFVRVVGASHQSLVDLFLTAGVDVNAVGERGRTGLLTASLTKDWQTADRLLKKGADPNRGDELGVTPIMAAAMAGHIPALQNMLGHGADPKAADRHGHTALHYAVVARQHAAIGKLLQMEPTLPGPCCEGENLVTHALATKDPLIIEPILTRVPALPSWTAVSCEALTDALATNRISMAKLLIARHAAVPVPNKDAQPFVAYAIARGNMSLLKVLLECGADPNAVLDHPDDEIFAELVGQNYMRHYLAKETGITPLMLAAAMSRVDAVKLLLEKGANRLQASRSRSQLLPLYFAAWAGCPEAVQLLVGTDSPSREELRVEVDLSSQRATVIKGTVPVYDTSISSGTYKKPTPIGEFVITDKHRDHRSSIYDSASMPFFMRLSCRDFGMHEGYVTGRPASHGCIRLPGAAARKLFAELPIGTWVSIVN